MFTEKPMRVLLIEDNPGDAVLIREMLDRAGPPGFELAWAKRLSGGLKRLAGEPADVVLLDLSLPDGHGLKTFSEVHRAAPKVPILVLSGSEDDALASQSVKHGAQDFLRKDLLDGRALDRAIRYAVMRKRAAFEAGNPGRSRTAARIIAFAGAKGGTGTTTVALNVAAALASKGRVIAAEWSPRPGSFTAHLRSGLPEADPVTGRRVSRLDSGVEVLFAPTDTSRAALEEMAARADFVVLDVPDLFQPCSRVALENADCVTLAVEPEPVCLAAGAEAFVALRKDSIGARLAAVIVDRPALACPIRPAKISSQLGVAVIGVIPHDADLLVRAQRSGSPVVTAHRESALALSFIDLAERLASVSAAATSAR
jgi:Flp pilus assembly CpaE family ATPase